MFSGDIGSLRFLIAHPGGPIFVNKDDGYWGIPKGQFDDDEPALDAAKREFEEETGMKPEADEYIPLGSVVLKSGKTVHAWAFRGDWEEGRIPESNIFSLEWPPKTGKYVDVPEIDKAVMADYAIAEQKMRPEQLAFVQRLINYLTEQQKLDPDQGDR